MANVRQCLGIDIGSHTIRVAELGVSGDSVSVKKLVEARLQVEPGEKESQRQASTIAQLNQLLKANKIKSRQAVFCVPGQTVFVRRLKLPATTPERLGRIIHFEAREQIPFPLEKTHLEYQVFPADNPQEIEVLLVAIKRDFIENFMKFVTKSGIKPLAISVSSLALHNFHEFNTDKKAAERIAGEKAKGKKKPAKAEAQKAAAPGGKKLFGLSLSLGKKKKGAEAPAEAASPEGEENEPYDSMEMEEIQVQVNLGATIMDLSIPKGGATRIMGFTRSVPVAGGLMDREIRGKLSLESMDEAMRVKEQETVVLASDFEISGDAESVNMPASQAATTVADKIIAEVRRTLDYFISQPDGVAADSVVLSGGLARMRYLSNYLEERMGLPVELASVKNEKIALPEEYADQVPSFVVPLGLAIQGLGIGQLQIDFLPQDIKNIRALKEKKTQFIITGALLAGTLFMGTTLGGRYIQVNDSLKQKYDDMILKQKGDQQKIKDAEGDNAAVFAEYGKLTKLSSNRRLLMEFLAVFMELRPPDILIDEIDVTREGIVTVRGRTPRRASPGEFLNRLKERSNYVTDAEILSIGQNPVDDPRFKTRVVPFEIRVYTFRRAGRYRSVKNSFSGQGVATIGADGRAQGGGVTAAASALLTRMRVGGGGNRSGGAAAPPPAPGADGDQ